jgi:competence protein ComEA
MEETENRRNFRISIEYYIINCETGENMFHFDRIQRKLLLIMGALILILSGGLIYSESKNRTGSPPEASAAGLKLWEQVPESQEIPGDLPADNSTQEANQPEIIQIYITGQVMRPGVYSLSAGERLAAAIEQAGGCTSQADLNRINLAAKVIDEGMYYVPAIGEEAVPDLPVTPSSAETGSERVNINLADQAGLETLTGIGPVKAQRIIEYRDQHGGFQSIALGNHGR